MATLALAIGLAWFFWQPLFQGAGFNGGDTYNYFFPLKHFYAEGLRNGELRLWNPRIGHGAPVLGESQTGVFYPPYLLAYLLFDLSTAYNGIFVAHYIVGFMFAVGLGRQLGLAFFQAWLVALVYVYGWFPPRACLEWAMVTGAWTPAALWAGCAWLESASRRSALSLTIVLAVQLLAGHFQIQFITLLALGVAGLLAPTGSGVSLAGRWRRRAGLLVWIALAYGLAGPQLVPTWELKTRSQRVGSAFEQTVGFGAVPFAYLTQWIAPWDVYANPQQYLENLHAPTNMIEAHLYFGLAPLALLFIACVFAILAGRRRLALNHLQMSWIRLGLVWLVIGLLLATGWPFAWLQKVPGFGFFRYPGRYGLVAQLGAAVLVGFAPRVLFPHSLMLRAGLSLALLGVSILDFHWVGRKVQYVRFVDPVLKQAPASEVFRRLKPTDRVLAMDGNTLALSGASCVPPYLGLGPAEYYKLWDAFPDVFKGQAPAAPKTLDLLQAVGVSHILTEKPLPEGWPVTAVWSGVDPFLHPRWGRGQNEPLYLYQFDPYLGRAYLQFDDGRRSKGASVVEWTASRVTIDVDAKEPGELVLTDLAFPGWSATRNGVAETTNTAGLDRRVPVSVGKHRVVWTYRPFSFYAGLAIAGGSAVALTLALQRIRRRV